MEVVFPCNLNKYVIKTTLCIMTILLSLNIWLFPDISLCKSHGLRSLVNMKKYKRCVTHITDLKMSDFQHHSRVWLNISENSVWAARINLARDNRHRCWIVAIWYQGLENHKIVYLTGVATITWFEMSLTTHWISHLTNAYAFTNMRFLLSLV